MDTTKFDSATRLFGSGLTRREALRGLVAGAAAIAAGGAVFSVEAASPQIRPLRQNRKRNRRPNQRHSDHCGVHGDGCGAYDADSGEFTPPYCCHGYECVYSSSKGSSTWTCQAVP